MLPLCEGPCDWIFTLFNPTLPTALWSKEYHPTSKYEMSHSWDSALRSVMTLFFSSCYTVEYTYPLLYLIFKYKRVLFNFEWGDIFNISNMGEDLLPQSLNSFHSHSSNKLFWSVHHMPEGHDKSWKIILTSPWKLGRWVEGWEESS